MTRRRWAVVTVLLVAAFLLAGRVVVGAYVDYAWYRALGATPVWWARIENLALLRIGFGAIGTMFVFMNLLAVRRSVVSLVLPRRLGNIDISEEVPSRYLMAAVIALSLIVGALLALPQNDWTSLGSVRWGQPFGESDSYFESDLGLFVYWLPFESAMHVWCLIALIVVTTIVVFLYALTPSLRWESGTLHVSAYVRRHLTALAALLLLLLAWSYRLDAYGLLNEGTGPAGLFTSIDHRPGIPVNLLLAFVTATLAMLLLWAGWTGQTRIAFAAVTLVLVLSLGLRQLLPALVQRMGAPVDPAIREASYVRTRALYSRRAYDLDELGAETAAIGWPSIRNAVRAVAAWDPPALIRAAERRRNGRVSGSIGWSADSSRLEAIVIQQPPAPESVDPLTPWPIARYRASAVDARGGTVASDATTDDAGTIDAALVSDSANGYVIVPGRDGDVAAPEITTWPNRLAHAWDQQNLRLLFSDPEVREPRMVLHRAVRDRVRRLAPFFKQGVQVTPLVHRDSLYWVLHLYSASDSYPLSERVHVGEEEVSYLHHAAVALVQAHSGRVLLVPDSLPDPIARTWTTRFPSLFTTTADLPSGLAALLPPPLDLAIAQATVFARVGTRGDLVPSARLPRSAGGDTLFAGVRWPLLLLPDNRTTAWAIPVLDASDRVRGLIVTVGGAQWTTYWHPLPPPGPRWPSIMDSLQHLPDTLATPSREAPLKRGPVRVVPTRDGAAFVQTTYTWRAEGPPTVARIAVIAHDSLSSGTTLPDALGVLDTGPVAPRVPTSPAEFRERVEQLYRAMREALQKSDWVAFGKAYDELGRLLRASPRQP